MNVNIAVNRIGKFIPPSNMCLPLAISELKQRALSLPSLTLTERQLCDLELLLNGGFFPLTGFMDEKNYISVLKHSRLENGLLWPMPVVLDVDEFFIRTIQLSQEIALRDAEGLLLAILQADEVWCPDKQLEAEAVFGTKEESHPGVAYLFHHTKNYYISGKIQVV